MNAVITDRQGNRLHVPPALPRLALSQRAFQRQIQAHAAALAFLNRLPETRP
jgi:hypothetical protein